jgi:hypothetical protein
MYWYAAQALAKAGYVVLTFDPQGQGQSDTYGQSPDQNEGVPAQSDGRPFYDGTEDAIDFLLSTPQTPYEPVPSCSSGTSHAAKHNSRRGRGSRRRLQPVLAAARSVVRGRPGRPILRRRRRVLHRSVGPAREGDRRLGRPGRPRAQRLARAGRRAGRPGADDRRVRLPGRSRRPHHGPDHQARARHVGRLWAAAGSEHFVAGSERQIHVVFELLEGRRRHRRAHPPGRLAPGLQLHPQPGVRRLAARPGRDRLVHDRMVRQVPQTRPDRRRPAADRAVAQRPDRGLDRPQPRRQRVLVLLLVAPGHPPGERARVRLRGPARRLPRDGHRRRLPGRVFVSGHRHEPRRGDRSGRRTARRREHRDRLRPAEAIAASFRRRRVPRSLRAAGLAGAAATPLSVRPCRSRGGRAAPRSPGRHRSKRA